MLKNKVVIVTGAGSGLGAQLAKLFCDESAIVIGIGRTKKTLEETKSKINGDRFFPHVLDISIISQVTEVISEVENLYSKIDILFNCAAVYPKVNFQNESPEEFAYAISVNVLGISNLCKMVLPIMVRNNSGKIINVGSWAHLCPIENSAAYSCSKAAVHVLTKAIAADIQSQNSNIEVHEWIPGHLNTAMSDYTGIDPAVSARWGLNIAKNDYGDKKNRIFQTDFEWLPPKSFKQRMFSKLKFWVK